jgi:ABC-type lipoprotein export system ATPase subunit
MEAIRLVNVVKIYDNGIRALNGINIFIAVGEHIRIYGSTGSGKTTLARLIAGMEKPSSGQVIVLGEAVNEMNSSVVAAFRNRNIGVLQRDPEFMDRVSLLENVSFPLMLRGEATAKREKKARETLKMLELLYAAEAYPSQLSILERHKAAIARLLIAQPKILLLDDFAVNIAETKEIKKALSTFCCYGGNTVIELNGTEQGLICPDKTIKLNQGKLQEELK